MTCESEIARAINDAGAIVGTATTIFDGYTHGVLLLPCQFSLLNGDTNTADRDGMDFNGNRPTTISATTNYGYVPSALGTAAIGDRINGGNDGLDVLGVDLPLGRGRSYPSFLSNNCCIDSLMMIAKVSPPAATNITYGWGRFYQAGNVTIAHTTTNTWWVSAVTSLPTGVPNPKYDTMYTNPDGSPTPPSPFLTNTPSTNGNVVAFYDNPGMYIPLWTNAAPNINDIAYHKFAFTYYLTNSIRTATAIPTPTQQVGEILALRRIATNNVVATDWTNYVNILSTTNIPSPYFTTNEIRALVSPSTDQIIFSTNVLVTP